MGEKKQKNTVFEFVTGMTVEVRRVNVMALRMAEISDRKGRPEPKPPVSLVPVRGGTKEVENTADEGYQQAMAAYNAEMAEKTAFRTFRMGVVKESIDGEALRRFIDQYEEYGIDLPDDDDVTLFVTSVALDGLSQREQIEELNRLQMAILELSGPTQGKIEEHLKETFPDDVAG